MFCTKQFTTDYNDGPIKRKYQIDYMPVRGLVRSKIWFGFKVAAYNIRKLINRASSLGLTAALNFCSNYFCMFFPRNRVNFFFNKNLFNGLKKKSLLSVV